MYVSSQEFIFCNILTDLFIFRGSIFMVQYTVCFVLCFYLLCNTALHDLVTFLSVQIKK